MFQSVFGHVRLVLVQSLSGSESGFQSARDLLFRKALEFEHAATRNDGGRHRGVGIFRSGTDKYDRSLLDGRKEGIGLRLIETMALVEKKISLLSVHFQTVARLFHCLFHVRDAALHGVQFDEITVGRRSDDVRERRFAAAGRAPENTTAKPVHRNSAAQQAVG